MGNVCAAMENQKVIIDCPHRSKTKNNEKSRKIQNQILQDLPCPLCKQLKDIRQQARFSDIRSQISLTTHNNQQYEQNFKKKLKVKKKRIQDFELVRGLGKGAFGKVYMIKQHDSKQPLQPQQDILSLQLEDFQDQQHEKPTQIITQSQQSQISKNKNQIINSPTSLQIQFKKQKQMKSESKNSTISSQKPQYYALKIINKHSISSIQQKKQALSQRSILQIMDHPFIVKLHYAFQTKNRLFLIVDLLPGGQLFYLLRKMRKFDQQMTKFYAAQILLAIQYLHNKSIIYRDLKPQNILLGSDGHIKITDFGLSKVMYSSDQKTYSICGTPQYIAPQVIAGIGYTQCADWFSFGSLIYDMLTGRPPFLSNNKSAMLKNLVTKQVPIPNYLSSQAKSLLQHLFRRKPEQRLGYKQGAAEIKKHSFFSSIDFDMLYKKQIKSPISFEDVVNLAQQPKLNQAGFQKWSSWHFNMVSPSFKPTQQSKQHFQGFTYENAQQFDLQQINQQ